MAKADLVFVKSGVVCGFGESQLNDAITGGHIDLPPHPSYIRLNSSKELAVKTPVSVSQPTVLPVENSMVGRVCVTVTSQQK